MVVLFDRFWTGGQTGNTVQISRPSKRDPICADVYTKSGAGIPKKA
jgi:hypothetical protein